MLFNYPVFFFETEKIYRNIVYNVCAVSKDKINLNVLFSLVVTYYAFAKRYNPFSYNNKCFFSQFVTEQAFKTLAKLAVVL